MSLKEGISIEIKEKFINRIEAADTIAISGHGHPDGDCVGSCLGLYNYLTDLYPDKKIWVLLEPISKDFKFLKGSDQILKEVPSDAAYDLFIALDCGDSGRLGDFEAAFLKAGDTICIDHHITNQGFAPLTILYPDASSTCEILCWLLEEEKFSLAVAECLYLGIVHDTGVFKHSNTTRLTMETAGILLEKGVNSTFVIDGTFYKKTYLQNQILGKALLESIRMLDNRMICSVLYQKDLRFFEVTKDDLDGIIDQLCVTEGVECAVFIYEVEEGKYKVSMRSGEKVNVSSIAKEFGGGGHIRAAGCTIVSKPRDIFTNIAARVEYQLENADK